MAPSHVPADHLPLQGQNLYADPAAYQNLFSNVDQQFSSAPSWDQLSGHHPGLVSNTPPPGQQSWHHSSFPQQQQTYTSISQQPSYASQNQNHGFQNASPYQYGQFNQHGSALASYAHTSNVDPALSLDPAALRQQQHSPYQLAVQNPPPTHTQSGSVTPQALQQQPQPQQVQQQIHQQQQPQQQPQQLQQQKQNVLQQHQLQQQQKQPQPQQQQQSQQTGQPAPQPTARPVTVSPLQIPKSTTEMFAQRATPAVVAKPVSNPEYEIPKGRKSGGLYILDQAALAKATKSVPLNKLVTFGSEPIHLATNRTALPLYTARQSLKDLRKLGADNKKIAKKSASSKSAQAKALKADKAARRDISDSESFTESSDDDSDYTDDEEDEPSPLPNTRPEEPHEAVRYDIIKATWYSRKSQPGSEKIKASMRDFWEVLNTIQKRWRADSKAVTEAEEQKKTGELPVLKSRVTSQRDLLQSALKSALEFAHPDVLYHLGQVKPFLYLCYQFLANRFKMHDYDGALPSVIYEILTKCVGTLTSELLEETKVIKALNSMKKNANEKNKAFIQQIVEGATSGSKKTKAGSPAETADSADGKNLKRPAGQPTGRSAVEGPAAKKSKPGEPTSTAAKKDGVSAFAPRPSTAGSPPQKRVGEKIAVAPAPSKARGNQVVNKPSGIFASLNAASKKPTAAAASANAKPSVQQKATAATTAKDKKPAPASSKPAFSFAETMASLLKPKEEAPAPAKPEKQLPPETEEEKKRRLRKESRRHLRVSFRPDASLVSIRYFHHDPEEEIGHDENFVRDAGDIGGEGRMFKQHKELDVDEDDDELETDYRPWTEPSYIDFSTVDAEERKRNYAPYGGGECKPTCPEKEANELHEKSTLMVFYSHPKDIPNSPREPLEQQLQQSPAVTVVNFGPPPELVQKRSPKPPAPAQATPDFSNLENIIKQFSSQPAASPTPQPTVAPSTYVPPPAAAPAPAPVPDIASILSALQGQNAAQAAPVPLPTPAPAPVAQPAFDLGAIMSAMSALQSGNGASLPPPPPGFPPFPFPFALPQQQQQQTPQQDNSGGYSPPPAQIPSNQQSNGGTKRQREDGHNSNDRGHGVSKRQRNRGEKPHKVLACKFYQKGMCNKGDNCTYIHDLA